MTKSTTKSLAWSFLEQGGSKAIALVVQIVLARLLAPEAFGLLAIMLVVMDVANIVSQSGLGTALIQNKEADDLACTTAFWLSLALASVFYCIVFIMAPTIASFYGMPDLDSCLRVIAFAIPFNAANSIQRSLLQKGMDFKGIFKSNIAAVVLSGMCGIAAAIVGWGVWALVIQALVQPIVACVVMALQVPWHPTFTFDAARARALFSYGWKICVTGILNVVYTGVSELILGKVCNAGQLGYYSQGRKWPNAGIHVASNALQNVMFPAFASMQSEPDRLRAAIRKALSVGNFIMVPFSLLAAVSAEPVVALLLGERWLPCVPVFQLTCVANCVLMMQLVNLRAYMALGDSGLYLRLQIAKVAASCAVIWSVAIATGDIYMTAIATSACSVVCVIFIDMQPARRMHGVGRVEQLRLFAPTFFASVIAAAVSWSILLLSIHFAVALVLQIVVYILIYLGLTKLLRLSGAREFFEAARSLVSGS